MDDNATMRRFGHPDTMVVDYRHWVVLLRPAQPTLGSLVLAAKGEATSFGGLPKEAHAELATITAAIERALGSVVDYERLNYLMLMMVDPHVHFHVIPRYEGLRTFAGREFSDAGWPALPDLKSAVSLDERTQEELLTRLRSEFPNQD